MESEIQKLKKIISELELQNEELQKGLINAQAVTNFHSGSEHIPSEYEQILKTISEAAPALIAILDVNKRYLFVNKRFAELFGVEPENFTGKHVADIIGTNAFEIANQYMDRALKGENVEFEILSPGIDKHEKYLKVAYSPHHNEKNEITGFITAITDITDIKISEANLIESKRNLADIFNTIPDGISYTTLSGEIIEVNDSFEQITGIQKEIIIGRNILDIAKHLLTSEKITYVLPLLSKLIKGEDIPAFEVNFRGKDLQVSAKISKESKRIPGLVKDITSQKKAEQALIEREMLLNEAQIIANMGSWEYDLINNKVSWSDNCFKLYGLELNEIEPSFEYFKSRVLPEDLPIVDREFNLIIGTMIPSSSELRITFPDGSFKWLLNNMVPVFESDRIIKLKGIQIDITDKKNAETALRESEELYRLLHENAGIGIGYYKPDGTVISYNRLAASYMGGTPEDFTGKSIFDLFPHDEAEFYLNRIKKATESEIPDTYEDLVELPKKNIWFHSTFTCIKNQSNDVIGVQIISQDITEQKKAEVALRDSELKFSRLFKEMLAGVCVNQMVYDESGTPVDYVTLDTNHQFEVLLNVRKQDVVGMNASLFLPADELKDWISLFNKVFKGEPVIYEQYSESNNKYFRGSAFSMGADKFAVTFQDVTEERLFALTLQENEKKYRLLFQNAREGIFQTSPSGKYISVNPALSTMLGYDSPEEIINNSINIGLDSYRYPEDRKYFLDMMEKTGYIQGFEYEAKRKDGSFVWFYEDAHAVRNDKGEIKFFEGFVIDITERRIAEEELKLSRQRLALHVKQTPLAVIEFDLDGNIIRWNPAAEAIFGFTSEEVIGKYWTFIVPEHVHSQIDGVWESLVTQKGGNRSTNENITKHRGLITCEWYNTPLIDLNGNSIGVASLVMDVTERMKAEKELLKFAKMESLGMLAGGIAHNMKNILANINANLDLAKLKPEKSKEYISKIESAISQATALATRFQTFSTGGEPAIELISLREIIEDVLNMALSGSDISSELKIPVDLWNVEADPKQLNEVFMNLVINAKQAMPQGGQLSVSLSNVTSLQMQDFINATGNYVKITIYDTGSGISSENLPKIFEPFFTGKTGGTGLGLSSVQFIIQKHRGYVTVESEEGKWTRFDVYLPATNKPANLKIRKKEEIIIGSGNRILFMDDNKALRENIADLCVFINYHLDLAKDGIEAIDLYKTALESNDPYSAVILDLTLQGSQMQGEEVLAELIKIDPAVKAIVFSGHSTKPIVANYKDYGFAGRLNKPVKIEELSYLLNEIINKSD